MYFVSACACSTALDRSPKPTWGRRGSWLSRLILATWGGDVRGLDEYATNALQFTPLHRLELKDTIPTLTQSLVSAAIAPRQSNWANCAEYRCSVQAAALAPDCYASVKSSVALSFPRPCRRLDCLCTDFLLHGVIRRIEWRGLRGSKPSSSEAPC